MPQKTSNLSTPILSNEYKVLTDWIDFNGHMNISYYLIAFDRATDSVFERLGLGREYRINSNHSIFTVELHINYLHELLENETFIIQTLLLGVDSKRLHLFHSMHHSKTNKLIATNENMFIHINMKDRRSAPFPPYAHKYLMTIAIKHANLPRPKTIGRAIGLEKGI